MEKEFTIDGKTKTFKPESLMMSYGYNPEWSEGAVKCPIYQTSTFVFKTAEEGKEFFEIAYGFLYILLSKRFCISVCLKKEHVSTISIKNNVSLRDR
jgi:cystathionine beta-lyase/cystathionine gamma-synthase